MIIPQLSYQQLVDTSAANSMGGDVIDSMSAQLRHWSLFGKLALTEIPDSCFDELQRVVEQVAGQVDLIIELTEFSESDALDLLNAGATTLICTEEQQATLAIIPDERTVLVKPDRSPDEAVPRGCLIDLSHPESSGLAADARSAELEMARVDCLLNIDQLNAELMVDFFKAVLVTDRPDGLWSTLIVDPLGVALGLAYSNEESLMHALEHRVGTYWSRSRDDLWIKGETSGATQELISVRMDCDRDCLRFQVTQDPPGFCHRDTHTCFGEERTIESVVQRLIERLSDSDENSFTRKLARDPKLLQAKLLEEAGELSEASQESDQREIAWEAADVLYFSLVAMLSNGVRLDSVYHELARRMNRVVRRKNKLETESGEA